MDQVSEDEFLRWAAGVGIGFDPKYPGAHALRFLPPRKHSRFWELPPDPFELPRFIASLLDGLDEWQSGLVWPWSGIWPKPEDSYYEGVRDALFRGAGVPPGWTGALRVDRDELKALVAVLYGALMFGVARPDDLYFIPDHGKHLLETSHHDVVHVECLSEERVRELVEHLAQAGYQLPTELRAPFKRPAWMPMNAEDDDG
jgi:hypothetical protein